MARSLPAPVIYQHTTNWQKRFEVPKRRSSFPQPSPDWQAREYEALMGRPPPEIEEGSWQFEYGEKHRTKAGREQFAAFAEPA